MTDVPAPSSKKPYSSPFGWLGCLSVFASAFCFYFSTVVVRWSQATVSIHASYFTFTRFLLGFVLVCAIFVLGCKKPAPRNHHLLFGRAVSNCISVFCFYQAVQATSVAEANILNMTYPIFVAILSWFLLRRQRDSVALAMVAAAVCGIWLILQPGKMGYSPLSLWGLASGMFGAVAMIYLNISRQYHDSTTVLFYMFGVGALLLYLFSRRHIFWPNQLEATYLLLCGGAGIAGQFLLTFGFRYVTAVEGGVISSSRILLAAMLGPWLASDPSLGMAGWIGALMIFGANVVLAARKGRYAEERKR